MEKICQKFRDKGFEAVDIPCNQFGAQSPGSDEEIHD
ncbi:MAG: glutathione peroxidase, partial [Pyramidobacter sp.]|nr:glutathione peroxidase [Pyramidobacter sp.]MBP3849073.1 glutathione peroxidase [Pyramidobacter sp.]